MPAHTRVVFFWRAHADVPSAKEAGLGVSATNAYKTLRQTGVDALLEPLADEDELISHLEADPHITHVIISAPWISTSAFRRAAARHSQITFACVVHSNVGFMDSVSIKRVREQMDLEQWAHNFHIAGNSERYCEAITDIYRVPCAFLPNLYYMDETQYTGHTNSWDGGPIKALIGGALREKKNVLTGVAGALIAARELGVPLELWMNSGCSDGDETAPKILNSVMAMCEGLPNVSVNLKPWCPWPDFRRFAGTMHVGVQMSTTESYNVVTADLASQGIPSVLAAGVITWAPKEWCADIDHASDVGRRMVQLLLDRRSGHRGIRALADRNAVCLPVWKGYLGS